MQQYECFIFDSYKFDRNRRTIELNYTLDDDIRFTETVTLPADVPLHIRDEAALDRAIFALHLIGGISYYKTCLPPKIEIHSGTLVQAQADFWNTVYEQGLGEFFYRNNIDFRGRIRFPGNAQAAPAPAVHSAPVPHLLVPVGGGKDSAVTIELLKKSGMQITLLRIGSHPLVDRFVHAADRPLLSVERALAPALFDLNAQGALNGHVPVTAYLSVLSIVLSEIFGFSHVVFSNERSADEGNVEFQGNIINHQWSKSLQFERMLRDYTQTFITGSTEYFSLLRPLSELHIMQVFAQHSQYFDAFSSCNTNWRIVKERPQERWCGTCPKCAFAFTLLCAFLPKEQVLNIFGKNLFADDSLLPLFRELLGLKGIKPFDCVGTPGETAAAMLLADEQGEWDDTQVLAMFRTEALDRFPHADSLVTTLLTPANEHCIPEQFRPLLPA